MADLVHLLERLDKLVPELLFSEETLQIIKDLRVLSSGQESNKLAIAQRASACLLLLCRSNVPEEHADQAVRLLRSVSVHEPTIAYLCHGDLIPSLIQLLSHASASIQLNACATLWNLSVDDRVREEIISAGVVPAVTRLLAPEYEKCHVEVAGLLRNLALSATAREELGREGPLKRIMPMFLAHNTNKTLRNMEILIKSLAASPQARTLIEGLGGTEILRTLDKEEQEEDYDEAAEAGFITPDDIVEWKNIALGQKLGSGTFGSVYAGEMFGFPVACKVVKKQINPGTTVLSLLQTSKSYGEFRLLRKLQHPNIPIAMAAALDPQHRVVLITELCAGSAKDSLYVTEDIFLRLRMLHDLVVGLRWMHSHRVIHRDLKLANLLTTDDNRLKITDFGLSVIDNGQEFLKFGGNVKYSAPELLLIRESKDKRKVYPYSEKTDVYSFGYLFSEFVKASSLFPGVKGKQALIDHVLAGNRPAIPAFWPKSCQDLVRAMNSNNAAERPTFAAIEAQLPPVLLALLCPDTTAAHVVSTLWKSGFYRKDNGVSVALFEKALSEAANHPIETLAPRTRNCLLALCTDEDTGLVTAPRFCRVVAWFGPLLPLESMLGEIVSVLRQRWFHGFASTTAAEFRLRQQPGKCNFLVRFSLHQPGAFLFSYVERGEENPIFHHLHILRTYDKGFTLEHAGLSDTSFPNLAELVKKCRSYFGLYKPPPARDYRYLFD